MTIREKNEKKIMDIDYLSRVLLNKNKKLEFLNVDDDVKKEFFTILDEASKALEKAVRNVEVFIDQNNPSNIKNILEL